MPARTKRRTARWVELERVYSRPDGVRRRIRRQHSRTGDTIDWDYADGRLSGVRRNGQPLLDYEHTGPWVRTQTLRVGGAAFTQRLERDPALRVERIVRERDVQHELDTYNELLGGNGELGATLLVELDDERDRAEKLRAWRGLNETIYARLEDGTRVPATWDPRQVGQDRLSSVQYLKFPVGERAPVAIGVGLDRIYGGTGIDGILGTRGQADVDVHAARGILRVRSDAQAQPGGHLPRTLDLRARQHQGEALVSVPRGHGLTVADRAQRVRDPQ